MSASIVSFGQLAMSYSQRLSEESQRLFKNSSSPVPQPRVGQLDASVLDGELVDLLKSQLWKVFKTFRPEVKDHYESELLLLLKLVVFKLTVWDHSATYGAKLQNLKFVDGRVGTSLSRPLSRNQKLGYAILVVGGDFLWDKLERYISTMDEGRDDFDSRAARRTAFLRKLSDALSSLWSLSSLANFLFFLYTGRYSTLILRLLRIRLVPASRSLTRQVNFEFQNRQLVWNAFTEFLLFIVPVLNLPRIKRRVTKFLSQGLPGGNGTSGQSSTQGELYFLPEKTCPICYQGTESTGSGTGSSHVAHNTDITNPYEAAECSHVYCYVCITTKLLEAGGEGWNCLRCATLIRKAKPFVQINPSAIAISPLVMKNAESIKESTGARTIPPTAPQAAQSSDSTDNSDVSEREEVAHANVREESSESDDENVDVEDYDYDEDDEDVEDGLGESGFVVADEDF